MSFITSTKTPPNPKATSLPNARIGHRADHHFRPALSICCTWTPWIAAFFLYALALLDEPIESAPDFAGAFDADDHAAGFGFMQNIVRDDFEDDGKT